MKQNILSTRAKAIILTIIITLLFAILGEIDFLKLFKIDLKFDFLKILLLSSIFYIGIFWVLNFRIKGERFITILFFPSLALFTMSLYIELIIGSIGNSVDRIFVRGIASFIVALVVYILILTANILNIGFIEKIPLSQAGRAAHYVLTLVTSYLFFSLLFSNSLYVYLKFIILGAFVYILTSISLWNINLRLRHRLLSSLAISLTLTISAVVLLIWPISSEYMALFLSLMYYMLLGIALEVREVISEKVWLEYMFLYFVIVFILFFTSKWGINGSLI